VLLKEAVNEMANLKLTKAEKAFFARTCPYIDPTYFDFLQGYRYDRRDQNIPGWPDLEVIIEGYWYRTILWEVPLMSLICELFMNPKVYNMPRM
jgi:nicotinate phosphoribosyltransferase